MAISIENLGGIKREVTLTIPVESINEEKQKRFQRLSSQVRIDGFRRGKVPPKVLQDRYGTAVYSEVLNELINKVYTDALKAEKIVPAGMPNITPVEEKLDETKPFSFVASFDVFPEIELKDFSLLSIEKPHSVVRDVDIDQAIERVREQRATKNDNGEKQLPELTDEFIATLGVQGGLEALKTEVRKNLERELKYALRNKVKASVIEQLVAAHDFEIPEALIDQEAERMREESKRYFKQMNTKMKMPEIPLDLFKENAKKNVKIALLFSEILEKKHITATQEKIDERIADMATMYDDHERAIQWISSDKKQLDNIRAQVREDALIDKVLEMAKVTVRDMTYDELMRQGQGAPQ